MDIQRELKEYKRRVDKEIEVYLDRVIDEAQKRDNSIMIEALEFVKKGLLGGGKRLRPALMYQGYVGAGGDDTERMLKTSISVELIHWFLLVHDDIIDRDAFRHGIKTTHIHYEEIGKKYFPHKDTAHFGNSMAIIVGDMVGALGNQVIYESGFPAERIMKVLHKLQSVVSGTVVGEAQDIYIEYKGDATKEEIIDMYINKTAKYTIEAPLQMGALLAGANEKMQKEIEEFSIPMGIAFQLRDDIIGVFGDEKKLGKPLGSDIREGKMTMLVRLALDVATDSQKKRLQLLLGNADINERGIEEFREILRQTAALSTSEQMLQEYVEQGKTAIIKSSLSKESQEYLTAIAEYMALRNH